MFLLRWHSQWCGGCFTFPFSGLVSILFFSLSSIFLLRCPTPFPANWFRCNTLDFLYISNRLQEHPAFQLSFGPCLPSSCSRIRVIKDYGVLVRMQVTQTSRETISLGIGHVKIINRIRIPLCDFYLYTIFHDIAKTHSNFEPHTSQFRFWCSNEGHFADQPNSIDFYKIPNISLYCHIHMLIPSHVEKLLW